MALRRSPVRSRHAPPTKSATYENASSCLQAAANALLKRFRRSEAPALQQLDQRVEPQDLDARRGGQPWRLGVDEQPPGKAVQPRDRVESLCILWAEASSGLRLDGDEALASTQQEVHLEPAD